MPIREHLAEYLQLEETVTIDEPWQVWLGIPAPYRGSGASGGKTKMEMEI